MFPEVLQFSACYSKKIEPLAKRRQQRFSAQNKQRKKRSAPSSTAQNIIFCHRARAANVYQVAHAFLAGKDQTELHEF